MDDTSINASLDIKLILLNNYSRRQLTWCQQPKFWTLTVDIGVFFNAWRRWSRLPQAAKAVEIESFRKSKNELIFLVVIGIYSFFWILFFCCCHCFKIFLYEWWHSTCTSYDDLMLGQGPMATVRANKLVEGIHHHSEHGCSMYSPFSEMGLTN